ncbi:MAG: SRPBCC family protein [Pseudomonadota bacterium]
MKIEQSFDVAHPADAVWRALSDVGLVARCMPGAELTGEENGTHTGRIKVKLGPIAAAFSGKATVTLDDAAREGVVEGSGTDGGSGSRASARLTYSVQATGDTASHVAIDSEIKLAGALAQFGRSGIVKDVARQLTEAFADNLHATLSAAEQEAPAPPVTQEIHGFQLIISVILRRIEAAFRRLFGRGAPEG